jgi:hypothetical protein
VQSTPTLIIFKHQMPFKAHRFRGFTLLSGFVVELQHAYNRCDMLYSTLNPLGIVLQKPSCAFPDVTLLHKHTDSSEQGTQSGVCATSRLKLTNSQPLSSTLQCTITKHKRMRRAVPRGGLVELYPHVNIASHCAATN